MFCLRAIRPSLAVLALALSSVPPYGGPAYAAEPPAQPSPSLEELGRKLESGKEEEILAALRVISERKEVAAAPLVSRLLQRGATLAVLVVALETAGQLEVESSTPAVVPYLRHREAEVRQQAARALLKTKGALAVAALRRALRSDDARVRGIAASGLGALGAREAIGDLFAALERNVPEAAASIGQLCKPEECDRLAELLGRVPFDVMSSGLDQVLFRPPTEIPDASKIGIIGRLRELGTAEAGKYLASVAERWPKDWSAQIKQALEAAARASRGTK